MAATVGSMRKIQYEVRWYNGREWVTTYRSAGWSESAYDTAMDEAWRVARAGGIAVVDEVYADDPSYRYEITRITVELG